jgi:2-hydroxy-3-keto-5-methylthiopentenyl-1-phosphate phosphatase
MTAEIIDSGRILFCDFDGTITAKESLEAVFTTFAPGRWEPVKQKLMAGQLTVRDGVREIMETIPSARYLEICEFVAAIPIRPGLVAFLDFLDERHIPFVVISGGFRGMVEARLGPLKERVYRIFAADVDAGGPFLKVTSAHESDTELVAKAEVMALFSAREKIVVGDGITDFNMARHADLVFARDMLARFLDQSGIAYDPWSDFFDLRDRLNKRIA